MLAKAVKIAVFELNLYLTCDFKRLFSAVLSSFENKIVEWVVSNGSLKGCPTNGSNGYFLTWPSGQTVVCLLNLVTIEIRSDKRLKLSESLPLLLLSAGFSLDSFSIRRLNSVWVFGSECWSLLASSDVTLLPKSFPMEIETSAASTAPTSAASTAPTLASATENRKPLQCSSEIIFCWSSSTWSLP